MIVMGTAEERTDISRMNRRTSPEKPAGAEIVSDPETMFWGDRTYVARDLAGHRWTFAQVVKEPE